MKDDWTHSICRECWNKKNPSREPIRLADSYQETCCYCGNITLDGIYVRENPKTVPHPEE